MHYLIRQNDKKIVFNSANGSNLTKVQHLYHQNRVNSVVKTFQLRSINGGIKDN